MPCTKLAHHNLKSVIIIFVVIIVIITITIIIMSWQDSCNVLADLPCTYLAHHELESILVIAIIIFIVEQLTAEVPVWGEPVNRISLKHQDCLVQDDQQPDPELIYHVQHNASIMNSSDIHRKELIENSFLLRGPEWLACVWKEQGGINFQRFQRLWWRSPSSETLLNVASTLSCLQQLDGSMLEKNNLGDCMLCQCLYWLICAIMPQAAKH